MIKLAHTSMHNDQALLSKYLRFLLVGALFVGLAIVSFYNYILFHSVAEIFIMIISGVMFAIVWTSRRQLDNGYFLLVGIGFLSLAWLDILHMLAYKGMNIFPGIGADVPTQLWIAMRYIVAISLLIAPFFIGKKIKPRLTLFIYIVITALATAAIYWKIFPTAYIDGAGLTPFKKNSEYIISLILLVAGFLMYRKRKHFDSAVLRFSGWSIFFAILSELSFTEYVSVYGFFNMLGHLLLILATYLLYKAIVVTAIVRPFDVLFRGLKQSESDLKKEVGQHKVTARKLAAAKKAQEEFLFQTIHDLRSPATAIKLMLEAQDVTGNKAQSPEMAETVSVIELANKQMMHLIENLHTIASGNKVEILFKKEKINPATAAKNILKQFEPIAANAKVKMKYSAPKSLPMIWGDSVKLGEVFSNLIENAVKYNKQDGTVSVTQEISGGFLNTEIKDTGIGISASNIKKVFKPYFRGENHQTKGSGLGLFIVKQILERMNGKIEVSSKLGKGTSFVVSMPIVKR